MATRYARLGLVGLLLCGIGVGYRLATAKPNEDHRNYEVLFTKPAGWKLLPKKPNTLLLAQQPQTKTLLRCSATQVVSDVNPEPDMDTTFLTERFIRSAQANQPEFKTKRLPSLDNGKVKFEIFRKSNAQKTIQIAIAVRGNTTLIISASNAGSLAKSMQESVSKELADFLLTIELEATDKWKTLHNELDKPFQ